VRIGYHGDQQPALIDLVRATSQLLGGTLINTNSDNIPAVDVLLWYCGQLIDKETHRWLHSSFNIYLLCERRENTNRIASSRVDPRAFYEEYIVIPFDPEELALRIVAASFRRGVSLTYHFDPTFYAANRGFLDRHGGMSRAD
jgi:hypothetical protein